MSASRIPSAPPRRQCRRRYSTSVSGACSSDNLQVTSSTPSAGVAAEGTALVFEVLTINNIGPDCTVAPQPTLERCRGNQ